MMQTGMKSLLSERMKNAWRIARYAANKFGGKAQEYLSEAMKPQVQQSMRSVINDEKKNEIAFDNFADELTDMFNATMDRIRKPGWKARAELRRDKVYEMLGDTSRAQKAKMGRALRQSEQLVRDLRYSMAVYVYDSDQDNIDDSEKAMSTIVKFLSKDAPDLTSAITALINDMVLYRTVFGEEVSI